MSGLVAGFKSSCSIGLFSRCLAVYVIWAALTVLTVRASAQGKQEPAKFDAKSLEKTSAFLWQWKSALYAEQAKAQRSGNDIALVELRKRFETKAQEFVGEEVKWTLRFERAQDGMVILGTEYKYKGHGVYVSAGTIGRSISVLGEDGDTQDIEPWMKSLKPGQAVKASGTIANVFPDRIVLAKVRITP